jgi:predicted Ser/Thr protein kinase
MPQPPSSLDESTRLKLQQWIGKSIDAGTNILGRGYQGHTYVYDDGDRRLVVKAALGRGPARMARQWMLANEARVYARIDGIGGVPKCYGFLQNRYLVLEYIDAQPIRHATIVDRPVFFDALRKLIADLHAAGVAHGDLKKKDNVLVVDGRHPWVIDFGVAVVRKPGWAPLNRYLYRLFRRFDCNAWVKLKYGGRLESITAADRRCYRRTLVEKLAGGVKTGYRKVKFFFLGHY